MDNYVMWLKEKSILVLAGGVVAYIVIRPLAKKLIQHIRSGIINRRFNAVNSNKKKLSEIQQNNGKLEYSVEKSIKYGFRTDDGANSPLELKRKGKDEISEIASERAKISTKQYSEALKQMIPLSSLYDGKDFRGKTLRVYVESVFGAKATLRDDTAIYELDLNGVYGIVGEFVLINLNKEGEVFKVNYILSDY
jgi:hypothetical protein